MKAQLFFLLIHIALAFSCGAGESECNSGQCYLPSRSVCLTDFNGQKALCPIGNKVCNKACYLPSSYHCSNGQLQAGAETASNANSPSTTKSVNSPSTTKVVNSPSTTSNVNSASGNAAATTASAGTCNTAGCPSGLCSCDGACYRAGQYNCAFDSIKNKNLLCQGSFAACNGQCYDTTQLSCSNGNLVTKTSSGSSSSGSSTTTGSSTTGSTSSSSGSTGSTSGSSGGSGVVVNPSPAAGQLPTQTADLRIINSCKETLWFEGRYGGQGAPIPGQSTTSLRALPGAYVDYVIPSTGLAGTRFWAKYGCDNNGRDCLIGDQMQYWPNPPGGCPVGGCTPPVDSLFEATWGCKPGTGCNAANPTTWFDTSQVDGWTIPYKLTTVGDTSKCDCLGSKCGFSGVDASRLDLAKCPKSEDVSNNGQFTSITSQGKSVALNNIDLRIISNGKVLGCMSPCKKLNWGAPYGLQQPESDGATMWMCCPTPTPSNCSPANGCITPDTCRTGPIEKTQFVAAVHDMAPGVYSYSYDDGVGLHACPAGVTKYTMEFCPAGSTQYPGTP